METYLGYLRNKRGKHSRSPHFNSDGDDISQNPPFHVIRQDNLSEEIELDEACLAYLQSFLLATLMEDTIAQCRVLDECNNELRILKTLADMGIHITKKFGIVTPPVTDELEGIDRNNLFCDQYKLDKLAADRKYCIEVFLTTYLELALKKSYAPLTNANRAIIARNEHRTFLIGEEARNKITRKELIKQVRQQRNHIKSVTYDTDRIIADMKTHIEDYGMISEVQSRYTVKWERARTEQHAESILREEADPTDVIKYYRTRFDQETRVHTEVELLTNIYINENLEKIDQWMAKYEKDMENIDIRIQLRKNEFQAQRDIRIDMEETLALHKKEMFEWIDFKDKREKARLYHLKMTTAAIAVQAWWRGLLVRLQLGPYKVAKGKKPDAKGKK